MLIGAKAKIARAGFLATIAVASATSALLGTAQAEPRARDSSSRDSGTRATNSRDTNKAIAPQASLVGPAVLAVVSIRDQRISVYDTAGNAVRARVSSGQTDYETPVGIYSILQKNKDHYSNLYDDAQMPFMQRLTWSGIALHAGALPGRPASHGCVRLPYSYAEQIFGLAKIGTRVIVARENVAPSEVEHPLLFQPEAAGVQATATPIAYEPDAQSQLAPFMPDLRNWPERQAILEQLRAEASAKAAEADAAAPDLEGLKKALNERKSARTKTAKALSRAEKSKARADAWVESVAKRLAAAKTDRAKKSAEDETPKAAAAADKADRAYTAAKAQDDAAAADLAGATDAFNIADAVKKKATDAAKQARRKTLPVSVFVSLKTQRVYVRQGHEAVMDAPVSISGPEQPIGTHVFTAVDYKANGAGVRWNVVTLGPRKADDFDDEWGGNNRRRASGEIPPPTDVDAVKAALDRITLPPEVVASVSNYVWPGSSLIVSDEELSKETGAATDFVVLISGEPQGGIKKRPRQPPNSYPYDPYYDDYYYSGDRRRRQRYTPFFSFW